MVLGSVYLVYLGIRLLVRAVRGTPPAAVAIPVEAAAANVRPQSRLATALPGNSTAGNCSAKRRPATTSAN